MGVPATSGRLVTSLSGMQIGDYIVCNYSASNNALGTFSGLGTASGSEIPYSGTAAPNGIFYFVKAARGLLIADRVVQNSISWDTLNSGKVIQGLSYTLGGVTGIVRSLTGGVAYATIAGSAASTDQGFGGWPTNNEWDTYIVKSNLNGKITAGDDNVWHWSSGARTWCQDTPSISVDVSTARIARGTSSGSGVKGLVTVASNTANSTYGFRPVFQYQE